MTNNLTDPEAPADTVTSAARVDVRFHAWIDRLPEPKRFYVVMGMVLTLVILPISFGGAGGALAGVIAALVLTETRKRYISALSNAVKPEPTK